MSQFVSPSKFTSTFMWPVHRTLFWINFTILLVPSLINELNKSFDTCSFYICVSHVFNFLKITLRQIFSYIKKKTLRALNSFFLWTMTFKLRIHTRLISKLNCTYRIHICQEWGEEPNLSAGRKWVWCDYQSILGKF